jgi:sulfatase modifying factor 1
MVSGDSGRKASPAAKLHVASTHGYLKEEIMALTSVVCRLTCVILASAGASIVSGVDIATVTVGNPGNVSDPFTSGEYGSVSYAYDIGATEVTNAQYAAFLNAVAATDTNGLYNAGMAGSYGGIVRLGSSGSYTYATSSWRENNPVNYVSFWDACRFANWLHNGQPDGAQAASTTEDGAYTLTPEGMAANTIVRNLGWRWAVTSPSEWYKAAYHQPASLGGDSDDYWLYPTSGNAIATTDANYSGSGIGNTVGVGAFAANYYGAFDMAGNVWEWDEEIVDNDSRGIRGGAFNTVSAGLRSDNRNVNLPAANIMFIGFRVSRSVSSCASDFNDDGFLDFTDFDDFVTAFESGDPASDFNNDGFLDFTDFDAFVAAFETGC